MREVEKSGDRYVFSDTFFEMHYDKNGVYLGQYQPNMIDMEPPELWFSAEMVNGVPCVNGKPVDPLTNEEMEAAG